MEEKARQLRNHKRMATGLFLLMLLIYICCIYALKHFAYSWIGYVRAFSEAAMVGALADWFAVTALFHHPLGIPIPHTNLIEKRKQSIGDNLGNFVVSNFLTSGNIRPYIQKLSVSKYVSSWLSSERNQHLLVEEAAKLLQSIISKLDDKQVISFLAKKGADLIEAIPLHQVVANGLQYFLNQKEHEKLLTLLAAKIKEYIGQNENIIQEKVKEESFFFVPKFVDNKLAEKISSGLVRYFDDIEKDKEHRVRKEVEQQLFQFVNDLKNLPKWELALKQMSGNLLNEESLMRYAEDVWASVKKTLNTELSVNDSALQLYFRKTVSDFTANLENDVVLQQRIDEWIRVTAYKYILRNTHAVSTLISNTVGNWKGRDLSHKLELEVGKDLQFIRINGTLVGGLVGLLIYTVTQLIS
ncbi:DUF445 domain-containing protein [Taibaiella lutea]|nr:DUF445 domain-containing protein [Taibaiella lutea]